MNDEARKHMEHVISNLSDAKDCLKRASNNSENGSIRERIESQMDRIENCLRECENISSGLSQQ